MHIFPSHKRRQDTPIPGLSGEKTVDPNNVGSTGALALNTAANANGGVTSAPPLATTSIILTSSASTTSSSTQSPSNSAVASSASNSSIPVGTVIGACVGAFVGLAVLIVIFLAWYKRSTDKMSASAARLNVASERAQQRADARSFRQLDDEKPQQRGVAPGAPPPSKSPSQQETDEKNFSMFKKSPSIRTAYTTREDENAYDLPKLEFTKYHPTLAEELALEQPDKPFAATARGVSWDGETLGDDSFLSMRSVRQESGTMSPTMVMAKTTPPATAFAAQVHQWESAEVLNTDDEIAAAAGVPTSLNPFADMIEEQPRARSNNPFFNARDIATNPNRQSRARSRSNSRTSRGVSIIRPDSRGTITQASMNPFLDMHEAMPTHTVDITQAVEPLNPPTLHKTNASVYSGSSFGSERAMASLIAALDLSKGEVEDRLRIVSMQGSTYSAYSADETDIVPEFPLPPGASAPRP
ncbi:uncharacterized protein BXZ73DRAFT_73498 [Epithele typhae]|uniref:uncharacterized protein n=1 Tax=Epithele typhae TaxID=378194 RepID=UPI0020085CEC|nr:uncharacterized protein BXZ73DRAFT_73498 [Epithele typhae]KAH9945338.1 hypothetical protein BXZ73DRAFT_73498 [Epithele typhae]